MDRTLLLVLTFLGVNFLSAKFFREYHYVSSPKTWAEAQRYCREVYTDLATVDNPQENDRLFLKLQQPGKFAWIGLYDAMTSWKWAMGGEDFNSSKDFSNWKNDEPDNKDSKEGCVMITQFGLWRDEICDTERPFVCFHEQGPSKYNLVKSYMFWEDAKNYCRSHYTDLITVRNKSQNQEIQSMIDRNYWIGLHRDLWANWSDQSPVNFTNWEVGQPDNSGSTNMSSCAAVSTTTGRWGDVDCNEEHEFICQTVITATRRLKLRFQSEADLTDPHIQQQILEQLHAKLSSDELADFTLRWIETDGLTFRKEQKRTKG